MNEETLKDLSYLESLNEGDSLTEYDVVRIRRITGLVRYEAMHQPQVLVPIEGSCPCGRFFK